MTHDLILFAIGCLAVLNIVLVGSLICSFRLRHKSERRLDVFRAQGVSSENTR